MDATVRNKDHFRIAQNARFREMTDMRCFRPEEDAQEVLDTSRSCWKEIGWFRQEKPTMDPP